MENPREVRAALAASSDALTLELPRGVMLTRRAVGGWVMISLRSAGISVDLYERDGRRYTRDGVGRWRRTDGPPLDPLPWLARLTHMMHAAKPSAGQWSFNGLTAADIRQIDSVPDFPEALRNRPSAVGLTLAFADRSPQGGRLTVPITKAGAILEAHVKLTWTPPQPMETPSDAEIAAADQAATVPFAAALLRIRRPGGWLPSTTHAPWAQKSLDLLRDEDPYGLFADLWDGWSSKPFVEPAVATFDADEDENAPDPDVYHPLIVGAHQEDCEGRLPDRVRTALADAGVHARPNRLEDYARFFHHFGVGELYGLEDALLYWFVSAPESIDGRFYSAMAWALGVDDGVASLNAMTLTNAVRCWHGTGVDDRWLALVMLGHVMHLLQDQAQPDHGNLAPHPGSGFVIDGTWQGHCVGTALGVLAAGATCLPVSGIAAIIILAECDVSKTGAMGYERLVGDHWRLSRMVGKGFGSPSETVYSAAQLFALVSSQAMAAAASRQLWTPLGLDPFLGVDGFVPAIPAEGEERKLYLDLTDELVGLAVRGGVDLLRTFASIVAEPPCLLAVVVYTARRPTRVGGPTLMRRAYHAAWKTGQPGEPRVLESTRYDLPDRGSQLWVSLHFGPTHRGGWRRMKAIRVWFEGPNGKRVEGQATERETDGVWTVSLNDGLPLGGDWTLCVDGEDHTPHAAREGDDGHALDANPDSVPILDDVHRDGLGVWKYYSPGTDRQHTLKISTAFGHTDVRIPGTFDPHDETSVRFVPPDGLPNPLELADPRYRKQEVGPVIKDPTSDTLHKPEGVDRAEVEGKRKGRKRSKGEDKTKSKSTGKTKEKAPVKGKGGSNRRRADGAVDDTRGKKHGPRRP